MLRRLMLTVLCAAALAPVGGQSVAAKGEPAAMPGRFGFALECLGGCRFVPEGMDPSYFRFGGPPRVSAVLKGGVAARAGLKVDDVIVEVNGYAVESREAGMTMASDSVEMLALTVGTEKPRVLRLFAAAVCRGTRSVYVVNRSGYTVDVIMYRRSARRSLGRVGPGEAELPIPLSDSAFRAFAPTFSARLPVQVQQSLPRNQWNSLTSTAVVCHED